MIPKSISNSNHLLSPRVYLLDHLLVALDTPVHGMHAHKLQLTTCPPWSSNLLETSHAI